LQLVIVKKSNSKSKFQPAFLTGFLLPDGGKLQVRIWRGLRLGNRAELLYWAYTAQAVKGPNRNFQVYDPLDFLAAVTAHIPDRREHLVRYYGWYSSVQRGKRRKQGLEEKPPEAPPIEDDTAEARAARRAWARLIKKIYEVDPLICPECSGPMRIIAFIEEQEVIRKILEHLKLWEEPEPRPRWLTPAGAFFCALPEYDISKGWVPFDNFSLSKHKKNLFFTRLFFPW